MVEVISNRKAWVLAIVFVTLFVGCGASVWFGAFEGRPKINSASMEDSMQYGATFTVEVTDTLPDRGDIVTVRYSPFGVSVARVIALPLETVELRDGLVYVDGQPLDEPYVKNRYFWNGETVDLVMLESDEYFVMNDNRKFHLDSRDHGPVLADAIGGTVTEIHNP
jgi:signal peptidase I